MAFGMKRAVEGENRQVSNTYKSRGSVDRISGFFYPGDRLVNFMISGGTESAERYAPLMPVLDSVIGYMPVIILHSGSKAVEAAAVTVWKKVYEAQGARSPLWVINPGKMGFEPFYGMAPMQVVVTMRKLAEKLNYSVTPRFERVVHAHIKILSELEIPISLSGFYYLCGFSDMGEFHDNVMELPCGEATARRIWADLGAGDENGSDQFDLFRAVINNLANDAVHSGWNPDSEVGEYNIVGAMEKNAAIVLPVNNMYSSLLIPYLTEELKIYGHKRFFLLLDGVRIRDEGLQEFLAMQHEGCHVGILGENTVDLIGTENDAFSRIAERIGCFVFFKHTTGKTAEVLSEIIGKYDHTKMETSSGTNRGFFKILPQDRHDDVRYSTENRYRVMPEEITALGRGQAIIFSAAEDRIIHYN